MESQSKKRRIDSGVKEVNGSGVDLTLIRKYLAMTPTERLRAWKNATRLALELKKHAPRSSEHA